MILANSIEERFVLDSVSLSLDSKDVATVRKTIENGLDWDRVEQLAEQHRLTPLIYRILKLTYPQILDCPEARFLARRARQIANRTLQLTGEMLSLVKLLEKQGIAVIPLKGPVLAMTAFGSLAAREFADLDLLVQPKDLDQACELVQSVGYKPDLELDPQNRQAYIRSEHALTYHRDSDNLTIELHWRLHDRYLSFPLTNSSLWANATFEEVFGTRIRCLRPEHNFIFLCLHGAKHSWDRLEWIACLNALARSQPPNLWPVILSEARRLRSTYLVHLGVLLADQLSSSAATQIPLALMKADANVDELANVVWEKLFTQEVAGTAREVYRFRFYLKAREHLKDRVMVVWNLSVRIPHPKSSSWGRASLPSSLMFIHYFLSPLGFLVKFGLRGLSGIVRPGIKSRRSVDSIAKGRI